MPFPNGDKAEITWPVYFSLFFLIHERSGLRYVKLLPSEMFNFKDDTEKKFTSLNAI